MALASELGKKDSFLYQGSPVRVVKKEVVAVGTHSHTKLKLYVKNVLTGQESIVTLAHNDKVEPIDIKKKLGQLISKSGDALMVMDNVSYETFPASADPEVLDIIQEGDQVVFVDFQGLVRVLEKGQ